MEIQDIANFAENLLDNNITEAKETGVRPDLDMPAQAPNAPDVSNVKVTDEFQQKILQESFNVSVPSPKQKVNEELAYKEKLAEAYEQKVIELEELVAEMTSVGMLSFGGGQGLGTADQPKETKPRQRRRKKGKNARTRRFNY
jgi:hypothetical protein